MPFFHPGFYCRSINYEGEEQGQGPGEVCGHCGWNDSGWDIVIV